MSIVARTAQHGKTTVYLAREKYSVTVEGNKSVFQLVERLEIERIGHTDSRTVIAVAPGNIIAVLDKAHARVVAIHPCTDFLIIALELQRFFLDVPVYGIFTEPYVQPHATVSIVAAEYSCKPVAERYYRTVENTVGSGKQITRNNGVCHTAP